LPRLRKILEIEIKEGIDLTIGIILGQVLTIKEIFRIIDKEDIKEIIETIETITDHSSLIRDKDTTTEETMDLRSLRTLLANSLKKT
jgi:hypothetical protein